MSRCCRRLLSLSLPVSFFLVRSLHAFSVFRKELSRHGAAPATLIKRRAPSSSPPVSPPSRLSFGNYVISHIVQPGRSSAVLWNLTSNQVPFRARADKQARASVSSFTHARTHHRHFVIETDRATSCARSHLVSLVRLFSSRDIRR